MPIHAWTLVDSGLFHAFHQGWISHLSGALNNGGLPVDHYALIERAHPDPHAEGFDEDRIYAHRADRIAVRHLRGQLIGVIEIVSPGNKTTENELRTFVDRASELIRQGVHLLVIDLFPPSQRDPQGIHNVIWDHFGEEAFELPADKPLTLVSYEAAPPEPVAYIEPVAVGDVLPDMAIFLKPESYVWVPLEKSYQRTWDESFPAPLKRLLEPPGGPSK